MSFTFYHVSSDNLLCVLPGVQQLGGACQDTLTLDPSALALYQKYDRPDAKQAIVKAIKDLEQKRRRSKQNTMQDE